MILPRRRVAPFLLVFLLIAGPLAAAAHEPREVRQSRLTLTSFLSEVWEVVSRIWEKAGSGSDPFGNPTPNAQPPSNSTSS